MIYAGIWRPFACKFSSLTCSGTTLELLDSFSGRSIGRVADLPSLEVARSDPRPAKKTHGHALGKCHFCIHIVQSCLLGRGLELTQSSSSIVAVVLVDDGNSNGGSGDGDGEGE
jgi:hypothetical protein